MTKSINRHKCALDSGVLICSGTTEVVLHEDKSRRLITSESGKNTKNNAAVLLV